MNKIESSTPEKKIGFFEKFFSRNKSENSSNKINKDLKFFDNQTKNVILIPKNTISKEQKKQIDKAKFQVQKKFEDQYKRQAYEEIYKRSTKPIGTKANPFPGSTNIDGFARIDNLNITQKLEELKNKRNKNRNPNIGPFELPLFLGKKPQKTK